MSDPERTSSFNYSRPAPAAIESRISSPLRAARCRSGKPIRGTHNNRTRSTRGPFVRERTIGIGPDPGPCVRRVAIGCRRARGGLLFKQTNQYATEQSNLVWNVWNECFCTPENNRTRSGLSEPGARSTNLFRLLVRLSCREAPAIMQKDGAGRTPARSAVRPPAAAALRRVLHRDAIGDHCLSAGLEPVRLAPAFTQAGHLQILRHAFTDPASLTKPTNAT
jgi:hypothetical protein